MLMARPRLVMESDKIAPATTTIRVDRVSKTYRTGEGAVPSLCSISFTVADGEFLVVVGPSGCGKSTLLKLLAGLLLPTEGEIRVGDRKVTKPHRDVGIVFQQPLLLPWRRVLANVMLPIEVKGLPREEYRERGLALLRMAGLEGFETKYPWQLSGGMQQRVSICRALIHDPKMLLMDEPFGALDALTREHMNVELAHIRQSTRKTVLMITHSIPEAVFLADRVLVMTERPGRIAAIYDVDLPRPRSMEVMADPHFTELATKIRHHFFARNSRSSTIWAGS
jgi:NitT/TauT family transport system ATP-binding protein